MCRGIKLHFCPYSKLRTSDSCGFPVTGLTGSFSDSVTQQFGDPRSIGLKSPIPSFRRFQDSFFSVPLPLFFLLHWVVLQPPHPLFFLHICWVWVFLSSLQRRARPEALIPKLVYIGEINALQMRLNTYSKNCRQCVSGLSPESGGKRRAPRWHKAGEPE